MFVFFRPADTLRSPEPGGGQGNLATHSVAQDCLFVSYSLCDACYFVFCLLCAFSQALPRLAGLRVVSPFHFVLVRLFVSPPATMVACGRILTLVSLVIASAFSFNPSFFVSPPSRHAGGSRKVFVGGLPSHSAFFVSPPPPRWRYAGGS